MKLQCLEQHIHIESKDKKKFNNINMNEGDSVWVASFTELEFE